MAAPEKIFGPIRQCFQIVFKKAPRTLGNVRQVFGIHGFRYLMLTGINIYLQEPVFEISDVCEESSTPAHNQHSLPDVVR